MLGKKVNLENLLALSELTKTYADYDVIKNLDQLINFLIVADTVASVKNGIAYEEIHNQDHKEKIEQLNLEYANVLEEVYNPSNYPYPSEEAEKKKLKVLLKQKILSNAHKEVVSALEKMIIPPELLERKTNQPFIDKDDNTYSCILEYVSKRMGLENNLEQEEDHIAPKK